MRLVVANGSVGEDRLYRPAKSFAGISTCGTHRTPPLSLKDFLYAFRWPRKTAYRASMWVSAHGGARGEAYLVELDPLFGVKLRLYQGHQAGRILLRWTASRLLLFITGCVNKAASGAAVNVRVPGNRRSQSSDCNHGSTQWHPPCQWHRHR